MTETLYLLWKDWEPLVYGLVFGILFVSAFGVVARWRWRLDLPDIVSTIAWHGGLPRDAPWYDWFLYHFLSKLRYLGVLCLAIVVNRVGVRIWAFFTHP